MAGRRSGTAARASHAAARQRGHGRGAKSWRSWLTRVSRCVAGFFTHIDCSMKKRGLFILSMLIIVLGALLADSISGKIAFHDFSETGD